VILYWNPIQQDELRKKLDDWKKTVQEQFPGVRVEDGDIYFNGEFIGVNDDPKVIGENLIAVLAKRELTNTL